MKEINKKHSKKNSKIGNVLEDTINNKVGNIILPK